jgi:chromosome segregation ATPase
MAKTITVDLELKYKEAVKDLDEFQKEYEKLQKEVQKGNKKTADTTKELGAAADKATGGMISSFKGVVGSIGGVVKSLGTLQGALIATGIGAFVLVVTSLISAFKSSEEGQDKFAKLMGRIGVVVGNVKDIVAEFGEGLLDLGGALKKFFAGDFKGAFDEGQKAFKGFTDSVKNFGQETRAELKVADDIAAKIAKANKAQRELVVERAKADREVAALREKAADKENVSVEDRIRLLKEAGAIEESITNREIQVAKLRFDAKVQQNSLSKSTKEDLDEEARLQSEVIALETNRLKLQKALTAEITASRREAAAEAKADANQKAADEKAALEKANADKKAIEDAEMKRKADIKAIDDELKKREQDEAANTELKKIELERQRALERLDILKASEEERANVVAFYDNKIQTQKQKDAETEMQNDKLLQQQKLAITANTFGALAGILGENSKAGKAAAIAQATINTYLGLTETLANKTTIPEPFGTIQKIASAATIVSSGFKAVKQITSTQLPQISGGRGASSSGGAGGVSAASVPTPPAFNVVGTSGSNQLADAIAGQNQKPMKAYVVASDVSTAQSLERNIVKGASL